MKALGALLLLLGLVYGFEDNKLIIRPSDYVIADPYTNTKPSDNLGNPYKPEPIIIGKTKMDIVFNILENIKFLSTEKVGEKVGEKVAIISEFLRAIKRTKDNELRNIFVADDFEENNFFLFKNKRIAFVSDSLKAARGQAVKKASTKV